MDLVVVIRSAVSEAVQSELPKMVAEILKHLPQVQEKPLSSKEICKFFDVSPKTLVRAREKQGLAYVKVGRQYRYMTSDVIVALKRTPLTS